MCCLITCSNVVLWSVLNSSCAWESLSQHGAITKRFDQPPISLHFPVACLNIFLVSVGKPASFMSVPRTHLRAVHQVSSGSGPFRDRDEKRVRCAHPLPECRTATRLGGGRLLEDLKALDRQHNPLDMARLPSQARHVNTLDRGMILHHWIAS